jgi:hypothetical protein
MPVMEKPGVPEICSFACRHSDFPPPETAGLCRTMAAVYCRELRKLVRKNGPCARKATGTPPRRSRRIQRGRNKKQR